MLYAITKFGSNIIEECWLFECTIYLIFFGVDYYIRIEGLHWDRGRSHLGELSRTYSLYLEANSLRGDYFWIVEVFWTVGKFLWGKSNVCDAMAVFVQSERFIVFVPCAVLLFEHGTSLLMDVHQLSVDCVEIGPIENLVRNKAEFQNATDKTGY